MLVKCLPPEMTQSLNPELIPTEEPMFPYPSPNVLKLFKPYYNDPQEITDSIISYLMSSVASYDILKISPSSPQDLSFLRNPRELDLDYVELGGMGFLPEDFLSRLISMVCQVETFVSNQKHNLKTCKFLVEEPDYIKDIPKHLSNSTHVKIVTIINYF